MPIEQYFLPCAYKQFFGISCPMCEFQRSLLLLLNGDIEQSVIMFPPLIPLLIVIGITIMDYIRYKTLHKTYIKTLWIIILGLLLLNGVYQNL